MTPALAIIETMRAQGHSEIDILAVVEAVARASTPDKVRSAGAIRQANYRARKAQNVTGDVTSDVTGDVTAAPVPLLPSPTPPTNNPLPLSSLRSETQQRAKRSKPRSQIDPNAQPDDRDRDAATRAGMSPPTFRNEWQKFRAHHVAKGSVMANWRAAWVQWIANWTSYGAQQVGAANGARAGPQRPRPRNSAFEAFEQMRAEGDEFPNQFADNNGIIDAECVEAPAAAFGR